MARAMGRTSSSRLKGDPAHFSRERNSAQFRPVSVLGAIGKRQPFGIGSASSSSEYAQLRPQWV